MHPNAIHRLSVLALVIVCGSLQAQDSKPSDSLQGDSWTRALTDRAKRGTLQDAFQNVRGDTGRWSDEPRLLHVPPIEKKPVKTSLDDWFDQLVEKSEHVSTPAD